MQISFSARNIEITKEGLEKSKEIYVVSAYSDGSRPSSAASPLGAAVAAELASRVQDPGQAPAATGIDVRVSSLFHGITKASPKLSTSGNGVVLKPKSDPGDYLALWFAVIECDQDFRTIADQLTAGLQMEVVKGAIAAARAAGGPLAMIMPVVSYLPAILKGLGKDDILFEHQHTGYVSSIYGLEIDRSFTQTSGPHALYTAPFSNQNVKLNLVAEVNDDGNAQS